MKRLLQNKFILFSTITGVVIAIAVAFFLISSAQTTKAVVLNADTAAGTTITSSMVEEIDVPKDTPGDFYKTANSVIGERITTNMSAKQLIYPNDLMSSIQLTGGEQNDDYVTTSITLPDNQAVGGLLTAGDVVDISVVPTKNSELAKALPDYNIDETTIGGIYYILANVTILDATTSVSSEQGSAVASITETVGSSTSESGSTYLVSVSYNDFKKLRIAAQYGDLYLNLAPVQNHDNPPLLAQMAGTVTGGLSDAVTGDYATQSDIDSWTQKMQERLDKATGTVAATTDDNKTDNTAVSTSTNTTTQGEATQQ